MSKKNLILLTAIIGAVILITIIFFGSKKTATTELEAVIKKISQFMLLPTDEKPTLATVTDKNRLIGQMFFKKAENGDKVLIYAKNKKAIIFRPSTNKIIEIGALTFETTPAVTKPQSKPVDLIILNGTKKAGLAGQLEKKIIDKFPDMKVVQKANTKNDYKKNLIYDFGGENQDGVSKINKLIKSDIITSLPNGEATPSAKAQILIIIGEEF